MNQYFSHDFKARSDKKMVSLFMSNGVAGVGIFWCIVEMLHEENGYILRSEYERIAFELRDHPDCIKSIVETSGLFEFDDDKFWSNSVLKRIKTREEKSVKASKSAEIRWSNAGAVRTHTEGNAIKEKKRKENNTITHFDAFWKMYPKKKGKGNAEKAWFKITFPVETLEKIKTALQWQRDTIDWTKDGGQFIPYPASYLNGKMWEDEKVETCTDRPRRIIQ